MSDTQCESNDCQIGEVIQVEVKMPITRIIRRKFNDIKYSIIAKRRILITEESGTHEEWYKEARNIRNIKQLKKFIKKMKSYNHDYGTICHAMTAAALAAMWVVDRDPICGGITGFQAGCIMWEFMRRWNGVEAPA